MESAHRVLLVNSHQAPNLFGGAEGAVENLAAALHARGVAVAIAATTEESALREDASGDWPRFHVPHGNLYLPSRSRDESRLRRLRWHMRDGDNARAAAGLAEAVRRFRPTVVHTHNLTGFGPAAWRTVREAGLPIVHTMHDYYFVCPKTTVFRDGGPCTIQCLECRVVSSRKRWADNEPDLLLSPSRFVADFHRAWGWFRKAPSRVVPNVMPEVSAQPRRSTGPLRAVGFIGRIDPTKGIETLLGAARLLPDLQVHIAGRGEQSYVQELTGQTTPNVHFHGFVPDAEDFFRSVDAVVIPSVWNEVAPLVVREAQGRGLPVVGAEAGGIPELVEPGTGVLFRGDPATLADALRRLAGMDLHAMQRAGIEAYARARRLAIEGHLAAYAEVNALAARPSR